MKLLIEHLGRIEHAEIDIRPLTVLVGKNGTNKTWTAHSYFKLLERLRIVDRRPQAADRDPLSLLVDAVVGEWLAKVEGTTPGAVQFSLDRVPLIDRLPESVSFVLAGSGWASTLGTNLSQGTRVELQAQRDELRHGAATRLDVTVAPDPLTVRKTLHLEGEAEPWTTTEYPTARDLPFTLRGAVEDLLFGWRKQVRALPAERISLTQIFQALIRNADIRMPRALVDFCYMMSLASVAQTTSREPALTEALERIAGGRLSFDERSLVFRPSDVNDVVIPIKATASLVKSLAGLNVFLSSAVPGDALFIDEPEMNAHPEAQVALTELFVSMMRHGIHVVIVTQSPYVLDHLNTLVEASRIDPGRRGPLSNQFALGSSEVYVKPSELAVYQFEETGVVRSILDRGRGVIDWSTFTAVSDRESTVMNALIEAEEAGSDA